MLRTAVTLLAVASTAAAGFLRTGGSRVVVSTRHEAPIPWRRLWRAEGAQPVDFTVAVPQQNLDKLDETYEAVTNPDSPLYTNYLTVEEINSIVGNPEAVNTVQQWLASEGVSSASMKEVGDAVLVGGVPASVVERIFGTELHVFEHAKSGRRMVRQFGEWSIPAEVSAAVTFVSGLSEFPADRYGHTQARNAADASDGDVVPRTIRKLYNIPDSETASSQSSQGVIEFQDAAAYTNSDMAAFFKGTSTKPQPISHIVGPFNNQSESTESVLDIQYIVATGLEADNFYWTEKDWLYTFAVSFSNAQSVPSVFSMSYGWSEAQQCRIDQNECNTLGVDSTAFVQRVNTEFQKIGLRGVSVLASSGDSGANGRTDGFCTDSQLHPGFPAASPYVTAVGATQVKNPTIGQFPDNFCSGGQFQCIESGTEVAVSYQVSHFTSGGGFSNVASRPKWQDSAVSSYLNSAQLPPSGYFNSTGRAYPDISAVGHNYVIVDNGNPSTVGGTSASSPTVAGIVALLNNARQQAGKKALGPLNPLLYKMASDEPAAFNDVTEGDNKCTENGCASGCKGFVAAQGWDPVTGLGTPNYGKMKQYVLNLQ